MKLSRFYGWIVFACLATPAVHADALSPEDQARAMFLRMTGIQLKASDARIVKMAGFIRNNQEKDAAAIATQDSHFLTATIRPMAAMLGSLDNSPQAAFNDFQALFVGITRDDKDARLLLTGNLAYEFKNSASKRTRNSVYPHYQTPDPMDLSETNFVPVTPQWADQPESETAGLLSTYGWAEAHLKAGTNRRATERSFRMFLCSPIDDWRDFSVTDRYVGRDVDRAPSTDPTQYQTFCRGCHATMDGLRPAYARFDFASDTYTYLSSGPVAAKMNQHASVFPAGYVILTDSWVNQSVINNNAYFGWRGATQGAGLKEFGTMIANSEAFKTCFAKRAFQTVCRRAPTAEDGPKIQSIAADFETDGYSIKKLFANTAAQADCLY